MRMIRILVTGASGYFGRVIVPSLLALPNVAHVIATDLAPYAPMPNVTTHALWHYKSLDLSRATIADIEPLLEGIDVVVHLAFQMLSKPGVDSTLINSEGQTTFLSLATRKVRRVIVASAAAAYGFDPARDPINGRITEDSTLAATLGVPYAEQKQALEWELDRLQRETACTIVRLRPTNVAGPSVDFARIAHLRGKIQLAPWVRHPLRQQLLHEDDLASAVRTALTAPAGAYNLAPDDWLTLREVALLLGQRYVELPSWLLRPVVNLAWRMGQSVFDASWLAFLEHPPLILANERLKSLDWRPTHSTAGTLESLLSVPVPQRL
ncbi:MAG: NAD-dependent epimerase/dehydratase family protein [Candidatus Sericytochromatia bacterium]|nr:NAD-dependent epimerase/dehydratase family protein [Candidatus Sericytochromatia bacterium]